MERNVAALGSRPRPPTSLPSFGGWQPGWGTLRPQSPPLGGFLVRPSGAYPSRNLQVLSADRGLPAELLSVRSHEPAGVQRARNYRHSGKTRSSTSPFGSQRNTCLASRSPSGLWRWACALLNRAIPGRLVDPLGVLLPDRHVADRHRDGMGVHVRPVWTGEHDPGFVRDWPHQLAFDRETALPALIVIGIWRGIPLFGVLYLAGLQSIPSDYYEAAMIDGAGPFRRFIYITIPLLLPTILFVMVMSLLSAVKVFLNPLVMTDGGPNGTTCVCRTSSTRPDSPTSAWERRRRLPWCSSCSCSD